MVVWKNFPEGNLPSTRYQALTEALRLGNSGKGNNGFRRWRLQQLFFVWEPLRCFPKGEAEAYPRYVAKGRGYFVGGDSIEKEYMGAVECPERFAEVAEGKDMRAAECGAVKDHKFQLAG